MLIVRLVTEEGGARANQTVYPALETVPEGWVQIPESLEAEALELLPWLGLKMQDGAVVGVYDDGDVARAAAAVLAAREKESGEQAGQAPAQENQSGGSDANPE